MKKIILLVFILATVIVACDLSMPDTEKMNQNCQACLNCLYLNQRNPDKTVCLALCEGCKAHNDFKTCMENGKLELRDCLLLLRK